MGFIPRRRRMLVSDIVIGRTTRGLDIIELNEKTKSNRTHSRTFDKFRLERNL